MFSFTKLAVAVAACGAFASATTTITSEPPTATTVSQCNNAGDEAWCCNQAGAANTLSTLPVLLGSLGIVLSDVDILVGLTCTSILSVGGTCNSNPVCCSNNDFGPGLVLACNSISL